MVHHRQRLTFGLESRDNLAGVHSQLDHFEGDKASHGFFLLGYENRAAAALADLLENLIAAESVTRPGGELGVDRSGLMPSGWTRRPADRVGWD